jgi:hypothetical protein
MDRSRRLTDGTRWRTFMRLLRLDDLMTSYTNARPGAGLLVVDLNLGAASGTESGQTGLSTRRKRRALGQSRLSLSGFCYYISG